MGVKSLGGLASLELLDLCLEITYRVFQLRDVVGWLSSSLLVGLISYQHGRGFTTLACAIEWGSAGRVPSFVLCVGTLRMHRVAHVRV